MKSSIVHEWFVDIGGSERCVESINRIFPSDVFALVARERTVRALGINPERVTTSFIQNLPFSSKRYRNYLPLFPLAVEQFDLSGYEVVISSSHAVAKGVLVHADQLHLCYCYTPMRYAWDLHHQYLREAGLLRGCKGLAAKAVLHYLRLWDLATAQRVDHFAAISHYIARRIKKVYGRQADVIYPPVDVDRFSPGPRKEEYYLTASRMVPYKKMDLIVEAFSKMPDRRLLVIGDGPDLGKVKACAGRNIELLGYQPFEVLREHLQKAKAFVFAAEEDFGILPVEAQACGTPVIAFGKGGSLETVRPFQAGADHGTGILFPEQTTASLIEAIRNFESLQDKFDGKRIREHALFFHRERFEREFKDFVGKALAGRGTKDRA